LHRFTLTVDGDFALWWNKMGRTVPRKQRKELNALMLLVTRSIWMERNNRVFDKFALYQWRFAGRSRRSSPNGREPTCVDVGTMASNCHE
jgi:hypothetical protein